MTIEEIKKQIQLNHLKRLILAAAVEINEEKQVFTKTQAAEFLELDSVKTLEHLAFRKHEIAYSKIGRKTVFLRADLLKLLERRRIPSVFDEGV